MIQLLKILFDYKTKITVVILVKIREIVTSSKRCKISFKKQKVCESIWPTLQIFEIKKRDKKKTHTTHTDP